MTNSTRILTKTLTLPQEELDRLALSHCRCVDLDSYELADIDLMVTYNVLTPAVVRIIMDVQSICYYNNGDYTYVEYQFANVEQLIESVIADNEATHKGEKTGLIESNLTKLTTMYVIPTSSVQEHALLQRDIVVEATKRAFYL